MIGKLLTVCAALIILPLVLTWMLVPRLPRDRGVTLTPSENPLIVLNQAFRAAYKQARAELLARTHPILLVEGDNLVLLRAAERLEVEYTPAIYHRLKDIAHLPLAVYVLLAPAGDGPLDDARLDAIRHYRDLVPAARAALPMQGFTTGQLQRQEKIVEECLKLLDRVLEHRQAEREQLTALLREMRPLVMQSSDEAARAQLDALHQQVMEWKRQLGPAGWQKLHVVVMGSHTPREGNLAMQYFRRVLPPPVDDRKLVYTEGIFDEGKALNVLGTCVLDTGVGVAFFDDPLRMHRDLLADAAQTYLKESKFDR